MSRNREALRTTVWYLLPASGWVLLINIFPTLLSSANEVVLSTDHLAMAGMIACIALLLYLLIRYRFPDTINDRSGYIAPFPVRQTATMLLIFAFILTVIVSSGLRIDNSMHNNLRQKQSQVLKSIVELKEDIVSAWLRERLHDATLFGRDYDMARHYSLELSGQASGQEKSILTERLENIRKEHDYINVFLLDTQGQHPVFANAKHAVIGDSLQSLAREASAKGTSLSSPLYRDPLESDVHIDFIAPLLLKHGAEKVSIGALVIQASFELQLMRFIHVWPIPSRTAETLLVKRVGDKVVFLNTLRYTNDKSLKFSRDLNEKKLIAAMALRGEQAVSEGVDYRGVPVLAATNKIEGTPWIMVAKVDQSEVYGSLSLQRWGVFILSLLLVAIVGGFLLFFWRQQQHTRMRQYYQETMERKALRSHYESILRYANDIFLLADADNRILDANERAAEASGYSHEELLSMNLRQLRSPQAGEGQDEQWQIDEQGVIFETEFMRKDGSTFPVEIGARIIKVEGKRFRQAIVRDISERKKAILELQNKEKQRSEALKIAGIGYWEYEFSTDEFIFNDQYYLLHKMTAADAGGYRMSPAYFASHHVFPEDASMIGKQIQLASETRDPDYSATTETRILTGDGEIVWVEVRLKIKKDLPGNTIRLIGVNQDITERKRAEDDLRESEKEFHTLAEAMPQIVWIARPDGWITYFNQQWMDYTGLTLEASMGHSWNKPFHPDDKKQAWAAWQNATTTLAAYSVEIRLQRADGIYRWWLVRGVPVRDSNGTVIKWFGTGTDIHNLKSVELEIIKSNRALQTLSAGNMAMVQATDEDELLQVITGVIMKQGGYALAVVDYAENNPEKSINPRTWSGYKGEHYWAEHLSWADTEQGQLPVSRAIRSGKTQVCHDIVGDPAFKPWRDIILKLAYASNIALPMSDGKRIFGSLSIYSTKADAFDDEEIHLLEELANDLSYCIATLRARVEQGEHSNILRQSLEQSIATIADTLAARDPYTGGHQRRVAELATAIAREMGLPEEQINGIHFAGIIHDLGKIHIPTEILSKPGKISKAEYALIQEHPQAGYDILKDVQFPWPIAQVILQHHEKLDGSGYPQGLKGDAILLEARIMAVADVVEAMCSHRPYRAGLSLELALTEIEKNRGKLYAPDVVDACLKLFRDDDYKLPV